jgi:hypothetical protein
MHIATHEAVMMVNSIFWGKQKLATKLRGTAHYHMCSSMDIAIICFKIRDMLIFSIYKNGVVVVVVVCDSIGNEYLLYR